MHERADDHAQLDHGDILARAVHRPVRERQPRHVVVDEIEVALEVDSGWRGWRSARERIQCVLQPQVARRDEPAFGPEGVWECEVPGIPLDSIRWDPDERPWGYYSAKDETLYNGSSRGRTLSLRPSHCYGEVPCANRLREQAGKDA